MRWNTSKTTKHSSQGYAALTSILSQLPLGRLRKTSNSMEKKISSERVVNLFGMRAIVGTFDKHDPCSIYIDSTINIEGTKDIEQMKCAKEFIDESLYEWLQNQDDYDRKLYIKVVQYPETVRGTSKTTKLHFDLTLKPLNTLTWNKTVEVARGHLMRIYEEVVRNVLTCGLKLKAFKGYNYKTGEYVQG